MSITQQSKLKTTQIKEAACFFSFFLLVIAPLIQVQCQQIYDGYPNQFTNYRLFNKTQGSYVQFRNMLDLSGQYLQSYTYELYLRIKPINSSGSNSYNLVDQRGTIIDCGSHSRAIIDSEKIEFVQVGGHYVQYLFSSSENEYSSKFLNYWRHYTFSYQNMSNQIQLNSTVTNLTSQLSFIRIFINGILQASFNFTNPVSNDIFQAKRDLCILGNAQPQNQNIGTALNADLKYLFITQTHRSTNFKEEIFHRYPHQERQAMVLYFKLDESSQFNIDFYNNKAISDLYFKNVQFVSVIEKEQSCECYSAPLNIFNIKRNSTSTQGITLRAADDIKSQGFLIDFFINFQGDLDETTSNVKTLIQADKMIKVMIQSRLLVLQIGDNNINYTSPNSTQYFRRWMHYGIAVYANQSAEVYRNGIRIHSFNFTGSVSNNQTINIKHEITAYFGRFRILKNITNLSVSNLMRETFNNGLINTSFESLISSNVVFDFKLTDVNFANQSLSNSLYSGSYLSNQYRLTFSNVPFVFDNRLCGKQGEWVSVPNYKQNSSDQYNNFYNDYQYGACNDNKYIKQFTSQDNTAGSQAKIMQANIRSVYKEMTIELWFNYQRNKNTQSSVIMSVDQQYNREERFKIELLYFKNRTYDNLGIGSFDQGSGYITHETAIQENQWFHTVWQCSNSQNLAKSYLFEYTNKYSQVKQAQGSISQPNIVLSRTYIGGDNQGQRRFVGSLKDLRIWFQFRTQADINKYRNIMPQDIASAQNLMHYYRFDSDNSYSRIPDFMSYGKNVSYDFTVTLSPNIDSTIRYAQDFNNTSNAPSLTLCEYNTYLTTQFSCALKTDFSINLQNYQNLNSGQFIIDSNIIYLNKDPDSYYSSFELLYTYPNVTNSLVSKQLPLFANQNIRSFNISSFKLNKDYVYIVQYTSYNIMYQEDTLNRQQIAIDPSCPSFSFSNFYKDENTVYLYNSVNKNYSVSIQNNTYCLFEDYYNMSIHNYTWQLVPGQNQTFINSTFNFTLLNNNMTLNITQLQKIPLNQILVFNVSLTYYNLNLNQQQIYYQLVNIKFVQENVIVQYTQNFLRVSWGDQMFIDAQQSFSLIPPFENREVQYEVACPRELFRTTQAYNDLCYIDFKGRIFIEFDQYRSLMLIDSYVHYNFTVTGNVKLENLKSSKIITVQFINITSTSQLCPNIIFEPYYNVSLLDQFTEIFPIYRLECDRSSYISRYDIVNISWSMDLSNVTWIRNQQVASNQDSSNTSADYLNKVITQNLLNVKSEGILSQILHFKSNYTWAQLTDDARYRMKVGESIPVNITYYLTSPELMGQYKMFNLSTSLRRIATDYQMTLVTNKYSLVFDHNETIILDILNTFDPQDPGVILNFLWSCPRPTQNSDIGICKNERSMSDIQITPLHRAIMNWKYNTNYTINATIINPKSQKKQVVGFTVSVNRPPNTTFTQVCPYFDFEQTNQFVIRQDTEDTLMLGVKDLLELDASSSYDTQNIKNRNFNFRWRCPNQLQNQTLCETNTKSLISLTAADRNNLGINFPGQNYKFGMQIYDGVRSSEWLYSSVFIKPDSPNNECLQLGILDQFVTRIVDQYYQYPLLRELMLNQSCQGIQYSQLLTKINPVATMNVSTYLEDQQRQIITESYLGIDRNIIRWRCDSKLNLNNICSSFRNQTLTLRNSDRNFTQLLGQVLKIEASVGGTVYSQYFQVVSDNQNQVSTSCQLESNQITYVNTSQLLVIGLNCNNQAFISSNAQYKWSIQSFESLSQLIDGRDDLSIVKIRPGTLLQNRQYFVNLTVIIPNWKYNLTFPYQLSTSQLYVSQVMKTSDIALSQKIGNFYETQFRLQLNANWGTITTTNKLNLFYQVILVLSDGTYHYQQPFQLVPKNYSINLGDLPSFTKMTVEIRNNYGQISNYLVSGYTITLNSKLNISSLLSSKKQIIDNSQDPIVITNQLIQLNQIWGMSSYQPIQSEKYQNFQYAIDKIANTRIYLVNNNAIYCYIDQLCINLFQNLIQLQTKLLLGYDQSLTPAQSKDIIQNYYYFLQDASFINSDYNQDLSENLLKILSRLKSQNPDVVNLYNQEIALINQRIMESQIVKSSPFESSIYSQGDQIIMIGFLKNDEQFKMNNYQSGIQVEIEIDTFQQISREINDYKTASKAFWLPSHKYSRMLGVLSTNNKSDPINNFLAQNQIDINIYDKQGQIYDIQGLRTPIQIYFNYQKSLGSSIWDSQCVYLNTGTGNWTQDETIVTVIDQGNQIIRCQTKHLSKFTVTSRFQKNGMFESAIYRSASLYEISQEKYFIVAVSLLMVFIMVETFGYFVFKNQGLRKIAKLKNRIGLNIIIQTDSSSYGSSSRRSFQDRDFILLSKFRIVKASLYLLNSFMAILNQYPRHIQWVKLQGFITILLAYSIFTSIFFSLRTQIVAFQISNWTELDSFLIALILTILLFYPTVLLQNYLCVLSFESQQKSHRNSMQDIKLEKQNSDVLDSKKDFLKSNDQSLFDLRDQSFIGGYHKTLNCAVNDLEKTDLHIPKDISPIQKQLQRHSFQAGIPSTPKSKRLQQSSIMSPQQDEDLEEVKISKVPQPLNLNQKFQNIKIEDVFQHQSSEAKHHKPKISRFSIAQKIERDHTKLRAHSPEGQSLQSSKGIDVSTIHQDQTNQQEIISMNTPVKLEHIKITVADGPATQEKTKSQEKSSNTLEVVKTIEQQDRIWQVQKIFKQVNTRMCQITAINGLVLIFTLLMFALTSPSNLIAFLISLVIIAALNMLINLSLGTYLSRYVIQDKNKELQIELPQGKLNRIISKYLIGDKTLIQIQQKLMRCFYENQNKNQSSQQS
eukprot:403333995